MRETAMKHKGISFLIVWTIVAAVLAYPIYLHNRHVCDSSLLGREGCAQAGVGPTFWQPFGAVWFFGLVLIAIVWFLIRPKKRLCPVCGDDVKRGITACPSCGHDFAATAAATPTTHS